MVHSILIVDNNDSFTYNLVEVLRRTEMCKVTVCKMEEVSKVNPFIFDGIIISPGPGLPREKKGLFEFIRDIESKLPLFGVCLGHQAIAEYFGAEITRLNKILHGEASMVNLINEHHLFKGIGHEMKVGRYHSWAVNRKNLPKCFNVVSETINGTIMALSHKQKNICSVQFHPESILTPKGQILLENWLTYCVKKIMEHKVM